MADESFLQPDDDTPVSINSPEDQMPGLAGYVKQKFEDAENGRPVSYTHLTLPTSG